ncbi:TorD/DmsD family molecular chaperone [Paludisphaera rhizosphaerae]|uniref:TorD/DmsD family molecular chaperone n=1 Tax=Paludisphaera rhizosphaerae TaxID=2711216 RepID=UPI0013EC3344|nr:molecular chaperone TorD family protein [Paludisphaera rhizosphaerae]
MGDANWSDLDAIDAGRERIYGFLGALLTDPDAGEWGCATLPDEQEAAIQAADAVQAAWSMPGLDLRRLVIELCQPLGHLKAEYDRFFTRSRLNSHSPLEMDHQSEWRRRHPEAVVEELRREYEAAGCPARENLPARADHAARELGFMAWLIARSRFERKMAALGASTAEAVRSCDLAQRGFFGHHLAGWLPELAAQLRSYAGGGCMEELGRFLTAWITVERHHLGVQPPTVEATPPPARGRRRSPQRVSA